MHGYEYDPIPKIVPLNASVLICGASFAGLSTAYWMNRLGYNVTVVEIAKTLKKGGTPVDIREGTVAIVKRMGLYDAIRSNSLPAKVTKFKNSDDMTQGLFPAEAADQQAASEDYEIDRDVLLELQFAAIETDVEFMFGNTVTSMDETADHMIVSFEDGSQRSFSLVFGCDGNHSSIRKMWFGPEAAYTHFLEHYFSITIIDRRLIEKNTTHIFNVPGKSIMLNSYSDKTDIVFCFHSETEIPYDYKDQKQQRRIIRENFADLGWKTPELLKEIDGCKEFYFDKMCQIKMPSWSRGRVALVGDAAYCASPAAGMGGSLAIVGAASLADALQKHGGNFQDGFKEYDVALRPFVEDVQSNAVNFGLEIFAPRTEEAIRNRNTQMSLVP